MSLFTLFSAFRNASDHDYTHDYRDESHQSPNSWVYSLPRLLGLAVGVLGGASLFWQSSMYGYYETTPSVGSLDTTPYVHAIRWLSFTIFALVAFRLCAAHSFFWLFGDATRAFKRMLPGERSRFPLTSLLGLCLIALMFFGANLFIAWDLKTARVAVAPIAHNNWDLAILEKKENPVAAKAISILSQFPSLRPILPKQDMNKNRLDISLNVHRNAGASESFSVKVRDCLNPRADVSEAWLLQKAMSQPVLASFSITHTGKAFPRNIKTIDEPKLCLEPRDQHVWFVSSLLVDLATTQIASR